MSCTLLPSGSTSVTRGWPLKELNDGAIRYSAVMRRWVLITVVAGVMFAPSFSPSEGVGQTQASVAKPPAFEVASMKLSPPGGNDRGVSYSPPGAVQFTVKNASFSFLMSLAFDLRSYQLAGLPKWADTALYDISAKVEGDKGLSYEQTLPLLQSLLEERLHLKVHHETKIMKGYALVVAKDGPKLQASKVADKGAARLGYILQNGIRVSNASLDGLSSLLSHPTGRPVVDKTGIAGEYDINLHYAPEDGTDSTLPSLFTAVQEQLGLKLEPQEVPVDMVVVDHVEQEPVEN
jgi:uncharacterized protein (TIGR03435 family)